LREVLHLRPHRDVGGHDQRCPTGLGDLFGGGVQRRFAAGGQHHGRAPGGEQTGGLPSDP